MQLEFSRQIVENTRISDFMKIRPLGAELFPTDGQTDKERHDEANSRNSANTPKTL